MVIACRMAVGEIPNDKREHIEPGESATEEILIEAARRLNEATGEAVFDIKERASIMRNCLVSKRFERTAAENGR